MIRNKIKQISKEIERKGDEKAPKYLTGKGKADMVNHPPHYNKYGIECIDALRASTGEGFEYYLQGNVMKYLWRYRYKNGIEDLKKANWYLELMIAEKQNES